MPGTAKRVYSIDAPDQQRLKVARLEIEAALKKHDLAGVVVLHTPGMTEFCYDIRPSYSCAWIDEKAGIARFKSKLADYGGDAAAQRHDQAATSNMLHGLAMELGQTSLMFLGIATHSDRAFQGISHTPGAPVADPMEGKLQ